MRSRARRTVRVVARAGLLLACLACLGIAAPPAPWGPPVLAAQEPAAGEPTGRDPAAGEPAAAARAPSRPITLEEAIEIALRRNPDLEAAEADLDAAQGDRMAAYGTLLPSVDVGYGYSTSSTGRLDPTGQTITNTSWSGQLTASYDIFSGFRRMAEITRSRRGARAANARYRERRFQTVLDTKTAYFEAAAARELVAVERDRVRRQEAQLDSVEVQLELGQTARTDVLRSEVALNNARLALVRAENAARAADFRLARTIGSSEPVQAAEADVLDPTPLPVSRERATGLALGSGPAVRSARANAAAAAAAVRAAKSDWLPEFTFAGGWAWSDSEFPPQNRSWRIFVFGGVPLFNGFRRENQVWQARARADAADATARAEELRVREEVNTAYDQVEAARASIELTEKTVELAREELEATQERFRFGRGSILEVQGAQIAVEQAEVDRIRARFDYQIGLATLEYLLGAELGGVEREASGARPRSAERDVSAEPSDGVARRTPPGGTGGSP